MDSTIIEIIQSDLKKYEKLSNILKYIFVDIAEIDQSKYYLLGSYAIREHRQINDLDINLDYNEFFKLEKLVKKCIGNLQFYNGQIRWFFDMTDEYKRLVDPTETDFSIEAFQKLPSDGYPNTNFSLDYLIIHEGLTRDINGHQFFKLETLLTWKQTMGRKKDEADIKLITNLLEDNVGGYKRKVSKKKVSKKKASKKKASKKKLVKKS